MLHSPLSRTVLGPSAGASSRRGVLSAVWIGAVLVACAPAPVSPDSAVLRAYVHNSYLRPDPVAETLDLGYQGLEADLFLRDGELRVGHDVGQLVAGRTLRSVYLDPLRRWLRHDGVLRADGRPLLLNIELKEPDPEAWHVLVQQLSEYEDLVTVVEEGVERRGAVDVVLVGWLPSPEELDRGGRRHVALHAAWPDLPEDHARRPVHELRLISARFDDVVRWRGRGEMPQEDRWRLAQYVETAHAVPGRLCRIHGVPRTLGVYRALLAAGVDLIGTKQPRRSAALLRQALPQNSDEGAP